MERRIVGTVVRTVFWGDRRGKGWDVPGHLEHDEVAFQGNSGARLAGRYFPHPAPKGAVVLAHPDRRYGQHWFIRDGRVEWLLRHGYEVLTFDFAPFGRSRGGSTYLHDDVLGAVAFARRWSGGLPVHVWGVSIGAFAACNASPRLDVESLVLEAPYPSFNAWYGRGWGRWGMALFDALFPRTRRAIQADHSIRAARAQRILVVASRDDEVTPMPLSRRVHDAAPGGTRWLELGGPHLQSWPQDAYREAVLAVLAGGAVDGDARGAAVTDRGARPRVLPSPDAR